MKKISLVGFIMLFLLNCTKVSQNNPANLPGGTWLIPTDEVYDGGPGKDGIPALVNPDFIPAGQATYLSGSDLVLGVKVGNDVRAYPHIILDWHEIANDGVGNLPLAITYCPLTGSGIAWERTIDGVETTFGVSGLLYNSNLIPYDRDTDSHWSQMLLKCVNGRRMGREAELYPVVETTWSTWRSFYPHTMVVSLNTGYDRPYGHYPYGDYRTNHNRIDFPISYDDTRLPRKTRVLGVLVGNQSIVFPINGFQGEIEVLNETFAGVALVVAGSANKNFAVAYQRRLNDGTLLTFTPLPNHPPAIMQDNEGNRWDLFGQAIEGPRTGQRLPRTPSFIAYWFAWGAFYRNAQIHGQ